ncbi:MAG: hypothetical protein JXX14_08375 [Deltaproteobacteria bacterium]|nr:hypothetical protein [Deltaproteobacteria bacterium]
MSAIKIGHGGDDGLFIGCVIESLNMLAVGMDQRNLKVCPFFGGERGCDRLVSKRRGIGGQAIKGALGQREA